MFGNYRIALASCVGLGLLALVDCGARSSLSAPDHGKGGATASSSSSASSSSASSSSASVGGGGAGGTGGSGGAGGVAGMGGTGGFCEPGSELVYVLDSDNHLIRFDPPKKQFTLIGPLTCPTDMQPNSMAIDRSGTAWVNYVKYSNGAVIGGALYKTSTANASCEPAPVALPDGWRKVGMGFTANKPMLPGETLYVTGQEMGTEGVLGKIDVNTKALVIVGKFGAPVQNQGAELTGNANAELFGFFPVSSTLAQIAPSDAKILNTAQINVGQISAYAFSFWGGDFYVYHSSPQTMKSSTVTRYQPATKTSSVYLQNIGFEIVGAGVAICAPTKN